MAGHDEISGVVVPLALNETRVEIRERRVEIADAFGEDLEFLATPAFD